MGTVGTLIARLGADTSGLRKGLKESEGLIQSTVNKINSIKAELLSISAIALPVNSAKEWAAAVNDLEDKTNMTGESASRLLAVGEYVGLATDEMSGAMAKMSKNAFTAAEAIEKASASGSVSNDVFTKFGIQILDTNGHLLSAEQILENVTEKHRSMANGVEKTAMEMEIFGRSGAKLNDLLNLTRDQFQSVYETAEKSGLVLSHETTQAFEDATFEVNRSKMALKGLAVSIGAEMLPQLQAMSNGLRDATEWFTNLSPEAKHAAVVALEVAAGMSAVSIGIRGVMALAGPLIGAINGIAGAYTALKIAAGGAAAAMVYVASIAGTVAAVGAVAYGAYKKYDNWSAGGEFDYSEETDEVFIKGQNPYKSDEENAQLAAENQAAIDAQAEAIKAEQEAKIAEAQRKAQEEADKVAQSLANSQIDFSGGGGGGGGGSSGGKGKAEKKERDTSAEDARNYLALFDDATKKAEQFESIWNSIKGTNDFTLFGRVDEQVDKVRQAYEDAKSARIQAEEAGNEKAADIIRKTEEERLELLKKTEDEALSIKNNALSQQKDALQKYNQEMRQIEEEHNALLFEMFQGRLSAEDEARMTQLETEMAENNTRQEMMQAYNDWRMEAEQTYMDFAIDAGNVLKDSLASGIADAIVNGKNLAAVFGNIAKQIIQMFIQWQVKRLAASALSKALGTKDALAKKAQIAAELPTAIALATAYETAHPGSAVRAAAAVPTAMTSAMGFSAFASGGIITAPTFALMGEGKNDEAVIPLRKGIFSDLLGIDDKQEHVQTTHNQVNFNVSALDPANFFDLLRESYGDKIKQFLFDDSQGFASESGVFG